MRDDLDSCAQVNFHDASVSFRITVLGILIIASRRTYTRFPPGSCPEQQLVYRVTKNHFSRKLKPCWRCCSSCFWLVTKCFLERPCDNVSWKQARGSNWDIVWQCNSRHGILVSLISVAMHTSILACTRFHRSLMLKFEEYK